MKYTLFLTQLSKVFVYVIYFSLILSLWACSTPVKQYTIEQLFPKNYLATLANDSSLDISKGYFYKGFTSTWDSVLVVKPYIMTSIIKNINISNYNSIKEEVYNQSLSDAICTLLFVKDGQYTGYSVFPRTMDLVTINKGKPSQLVWLNKKNFNELCVKKSSSVGPRYSVVFNFSGSTSQRPAHSPK